MTSIRGATVALALALAACGKPVVPDPADAAQAYAEAAKRGDADALYEMLTEQARQTHGRQGVGKLVKESRTELARQGAALESDGVEVRAVATIRYADGESAVLEVEDGRFRVSATGTLPAGAQTPAEALDELRQVVARRSYAGLMRVLTNDTRSAMESDLESLVDGLEDPETLDVRISGDTALVTVPGGHFVRLKREEGVWRVEDFD